MYLDSITFWTTVLSGIIIGLVVGGILGLIGYKIWIKQHLYSKRLELYTSIVHSLFLFTAILLEYLKERDLESLNKIKRETKILYDNLLEERTKLATYFGLEYINPINEIFDIYYQLNNKECKMKYRELSDYISERTLIILNLRTKLNLLK